MAVLMCERATQSLENVVSLLCNISSTYYAYWYQRGMTSLLEINQTHFQTKGRCIEKYHSDQYVFSDQVNRCNRCILFVQRHRNLLQYRESECNEDTSSSTCSFTPDADLYTLHRNDSKPEPCPISPSYSLTYTKHGHACNKSGSILAECANENQFRLHFACLNSTIQLTCVATWTEGFHSYFAARTYQDHYICFHYSTKHSRITSFEMSMASSCTDAANKHTATVMNLSSTRHTELPCTYPEWLYREWNSLNNSLHVTINNGEIELNTGDYDNSKRFHCITLLQALPNKNTQIYLVRSFVNCHVIEKCLTIIQRSSNVIELLTGPKDECTNEDLFDLKLTLFTKSLDSIEPCPTNLGHYSLSPILHNTKTSRRIYHVNNLCKKIRSVQLSVGCYNDKKLTTTFHCIEPFGTDVEEHRSFKHDDICLASWQQDTIQYLIVQSSYSNQAYCMNIITHVDDIYAHDKKI
ncbi:unnamed protein product [Didymodactylos carnosus]|uniref:Uncharacterized protein n=1 Tax=Didymodactylos carnosus TaxID=1234261 RepID=A0A814UGJ3_9BILA|nr:unnamed protein product [Didymodactylos carnosus]CAF3937160.1 unnamed protein product [Didymodactylos carnosus]